MQHMMPILSLVTLSAMVLPAVAETSPAAACEQLGKALGAELSALRAMQDAPSVEANIAALEAALAELGSMDRSPEAEDALWQYIDNAQEDVKMRLVEQLQRLAVEFMRLEKAAFFNSARLREALAPQL